MVSKLISTSQLLASIQSKAPMYLLDTTYIIQDTTPLENHYKQRIPTSRFLDLKELSEKSSGLTLTMPSEVTFVNFMRRIHVKNDEIPIILYDYANFTSPRTWFMFKVFGRRNVSILDGGLYKWNLEKLPIESGEYEIYKQKDKGNGYDYVKNELLLSKFEDVKQKSVDKSEKIIDGRPEKVFKEGSIPNSINIPTDRVYNSDKTFRNPEELKQLYRSIKDDEKVIQSCRIGHSACINLFAMDLIGKESRLYDGSFEEWSKVSKASV